MAKAQKITAEQVESIVLDLAKQGTPAEKIGLILRDQHGIPKAKIYGKKVSQILSENGIDSNSELKNIQNKVEKLKTHFEKNKHDWYAKRRIAQYSSKIKKLSHSKTTKQ